MFYPCCVVHNKDPCLQVGGQITISGDDISSSQVLCSILVWTMSEGIFIKLQKQNKTNNKTKNKKQQQKTQTKIKTTKKPPNNQPINKLMEEISKEGNVQDSDGWKE